jgi:hypothetical protein
VSWPQPRCFMDLANYLVYGITINSCTNGEPPRICKHWQRREWGESRSHHERSQKSRLVLFWQSVWICCSLPGWCSYNQYRLRPSHAMDGRASVFKCPSSRDMHSRRAQLAHQSLTRSLWLERRYFELAHGVLLFRGLAGHSISIHPQAAILPTKQAIHTRLANHRTWSAPDPSR